MTADLHELLSAVREYKTLSAPFVCVLTMTYEEQKTYAAKLQTSLERLEAVLRAWEDWPGTDRREEAKRLYEAHSLSAEQVSQVLYGD